MDEITQKGILYVIAGVGALITFVGGLLGIAVAGKSLFHRAVDPDREYVTRAEMKTCIGEIKREMDTIRIDLMHQIEKLDEYMHKAAHNQNNSLGAISNKINALLIKGGLKLQDEDGA